MDAIADFRDKGYYIAMLNGDKCRTEDAFHAEVAKAFRFPDGYLKTLEALKANINDLSWLQEHDKLLVIYNEHSFLSKAAKGVKEKVMAVFESADNLTVLLG